MVHQRCEEFFAAHFLKKRKMDGNVFSTEEMNQRVLRKRKVIWIFAKNFSLKFCWIRKSLCEKQQQQYDDRFLAFFGLVRKKSYNGWSGNVFFRITTNIFGEKEEDNNRRKDYILLYLHRTPHLWWSNFAIHFIYYFSQNNKKMKTFCSNSFLLFLCVYLVMRVSRGGVNNSFRNI